MSAPIDEEPRESEQNQQEEQKEQKNDPLSGLRSQYFSERVVIDNYVTAGTTALASADGVADKIVTAAFSVATAYAAVIALVAPKDSTSPVLTITPFVLLAVAILLALIAQSVQLQLEPATNVVEEISSRVTNCTNAKRHWGYGALAALVVGLGLAGYAIYQTYGPGAKPKVSSIRAEIWLNRAGGHLVREACGKARSPLVGRVDDESALTAATVPVRVTKYVCPKGRGTLLLPRRAIVVVKHGAS